MSFNPRAPLPGRASALEPARNPAASHVSILAPRCRGAHRDIRSAQSGSQCVSILAPRCRGAHLPHDQFAPDNQGFQSSRPVAGARIAHIVRNAADCNKVSILAPRCRGAHRLGQPKIIPDCRCFNPRAPLPGRASPRPVPVRGFLPCFNPRAPLPGRASARVSAPAGFVRVSILAPRCRGAHRFARNRRKSRTFRHAFREPVLEPFSVLPLDTQSTNVVLKIQILACNANLPAFSCELGVRATGHHLLQHERPIKIGGLENPVLPDFAAS